MLIDTVKQGYSKKCEAIQSKAIQSGTKTKGTQNGVNQKPKKLKAMPIPAAAIPLLASAGTSILETGINAISQGRQNKAQRKWNEKMYKKQRQDALSDWTMQNSYNDPTAQMQRLKSAGLNPNLVYGKGADAQMGAPIRSTDAKSYAPQAFKASIPDGAQAVQTIHNIEQTRHQTDNLKKQNDVLTEEAALKRAQTLSTLIGNDMSKFDLGLKTELRQTSADMARESLRKLRTDIDLSMNSDRRQAIMQASNLGEAVERVLRSKAERSSIPKRNLGIDLENQLKQMDIELRRMGIMPGDPIWSRVAGRIINVVTDPKHKPTRSAIKNSINAVPGLKLPW